MVTVPLAIWLRNYWALVIGMVVGKIFAVVISYWMHSYRPRLSLAGASDLMSFSGWLLVNNTLYFFNERLTDFVVGRMAGASALGLYNVSYEISNMPMRGYRQWRRSIASCCRHTPRFRATRAT
jgi:O-antigen/teichoic acid export membrane protein